VPDPDAILVASENIAAYNAGDWDRLRAVLADDVVYDEIGSRRKMHGADALVKAYRVWKIAFPDGTGTITKAFGSGNSVTIEVTWQATHSGPLMLDDRSIPPTGKHWMIFGAQVITVEDGKIKHFRQYFDLMTLLDQIGVKL
jgi:steroid delta-isomerase-like uncharacterized protein